MLILSVCLAIRFVCCSSAASQSSNQGTAIFLSFVAISLGAFVGIMLMMFTLLLSSAKYWNVFFGGFGRVTGAVSRAWVTKDVWSERGSDRKVRGWVSVEEEAEEGITVSLARLMAIGCLFVAFVVCWAVALSVIAFSKAGYEGLSVGELGLAALPALSLGPLWIGGLDRLHKYYSELQARIAGNILRLQESTEQKFIDLVSDPVAACALKKKMRALSVARASLEDYMAGIPCEEDKNGRYLPNDRAEPSEVSLVVADPGTDSGPDSKRRGFIF